MIELAKCSKCSAKVLPTAEATCPNCQAPIAVESTAPLVQPEAASSDACPPCGADQEGTQVEDQSAGPERHTVCRTEPRGARSTASRFLSWFITCVIVFALARIIFPNGINIGWLVVPYLILKFAVVDPLLALVLGRNPHKQ
jgi:hypothetical protein